MSHVGVSGKVYPGGSSSQCKGPVTHVSEPKVKGRGAGVRPQRHWVWAEADEL